MKWIKGKCSNSRKKLYTMGLSYIYKYIYDFFSAIKIHMMDNVISRF